MQCRTGCGACCIAISIHLPFYEMPAGKPAGVPCLHLSEDMRCKLIGDVRRPALCDAFMPERDFCGDNRAEALQRLTQLELESLPETLARGGAA